MSQRFRITRSSLRVSIKKTLAAGTSAVLLEGARRIGKSTIVEETLAKQQERVSLI